MATVNDEDRKCAIATIQLSYETTDTDRLATRVAEYRERIEAHVNAGWRDAWDKKEAFVLKLENELANSTRRVAELERNMGDFANAIGTAAGLRDVGFKAPELIVEAVRAMPARIAELESQLRHERADCFAEMEPKIAELEAQLAAAKPTLTAEEEAAIYKILGYIHPAKNETQLLASIIRKYTSPCPPPKAPPTDAELVAGLDAGELEVDDVIDALRARGGSTLVKRDAVRYGIDCGERITTDVRQLADQVHREMFSAQDGKWFRHTGNTSTEVTERDVPSLILNALRARGAK